LHDEIHLETEVDYLHSLVHPHTNEEVHVVFWHPSVWAGFGHRVWKLPNYVGHEVVKGKCSVACHLSADRTQVVRADAVVFEPIAFGQTPEWRRGAGVPLPEKRPWQAWVMFGYETPQYFPLMAEPGFVAHVDLNMTYEQNLSQVPITFACHWGGGSLEDFTRPETVRPASAREGMAVFVASNCKHGGALFRTRYVQALMRAGLEVDSYGECLRNRPFPPELQGEKENYWSDPGRAWQVKKALFARYKFVLAFENANETDYVTEKVYQAWQAGAVPVYMGAPNLREWAPADDSFVDARAFPSPAALAEHLRHLAADDAAYARLHAWRSRPLPRRFTEKFERCVFYNAECRLCEALAARRRALPPGALEARRAALDALDALALSGAASREDAFALEFDGQDDALIVEHDERLNLEAPYTLAAWVRPEAFRDLRILDKNPAGSVQGYDFDVFRDNEATAFGVLRLCAAGGCWLGSRPLLQGQWYHAAAAVTDRRVRLYLNGALDAEFETGAPTTANQLPLTIGSAATGGAHWHGQLDDISMWRRALNATEIRRLMYQRLSGNEPGLLAYWPLNEGHGTLAQDLSPNHFVARFRSEPHWVPVSSRPLLTNPCT
jgi:hypothetical protein